MRRSWSAVGLAMLVACGVATGIACSSNTQLSNMWVAPNYTPHHYHRIAVVALVNSEANRRAIEDALVSRLSPRTNAVASYTLVANERELNTERFQREASRIGADGILTVRMLGKQRETVYQPGYVHVRPYGPGFWRRWGGWYDTWATPGYYEQYNVYSLESSLFDLSGDQLAWSGVTQTTDPNSLKDLVNSVADAISKELKKRHVLA